MPPTLLQEKSLKPETLPWVSFGFSFLLIISVTTMSIIYGIDWWKPSLDTQVTADPELCSPINFKCLGCTKDLGCTLAARGKNTVNANRHLNLSMNSFTYVLTGESVIINLCAGSTESVILSLNSSAAEDSGHIGYGKCLYDSIEKYLVGEIETRPGIWMPVKIEEDPGATAQIIEYSMWKTTLFSNGTTIRYQDNSIVESPSRFCFLSEKQSGNSYFCAAIRMSMFSWTIEESRSGLLTLIGIIGGLIGILYRICFWILILIRRIYSNIHHGLISEKDEGRLRTDLSLQKFSVPLQEEMV